ncbi:MAG: hypothetical protein PHN72_02750 [Bacilli bacterium]|nr:hypothetical protein [Bacilli bacterium]
MQVLNKEELLEIKGGAITGTYINAVVKGIEALLEVGRSLGTAVRRWVEGSICGPL